MKLDNENMKSNTRKTFLNFINSTKSFHGKTPSV